MADHDAVLIVGAGALQVPMIREAQRSGLTVIATDANPDAPGASIAREFFPIDTYDTKGHTLLGQLLADHHSWHLLGVVTCGSDTAPSVAAAASAAGVRGIPLEVARLTHNKAAVREHLSNAGLDIYQPRWICGGNYPDTQHASLAEGDLCGGYPVVVKALEQRASRGVRIATDQSSFVEATACALQYGKEYLIEQQLSGSEHSAELILGDSRETLWWNIVDRPFGYSRGVPIELGHINPTNLDEHQQQQILLMTLAAARALGVTWGPFKVDCMMTIDGPKILECTARLSGGWDCQWSSPATGRHPMRTLLYLACGFPLEPQRVMRDAHGYGAVAAVIPDGIAHNGERTQWAMRWAHDYATAWSLATTAAADLAAQRLGGEA